jgi:riboflavin kinase/FMN adenylyltransferase
MSVYSDFASFRQAYPHCVATIGKYDGLHIGHQQVLDTLLRLAGEEGLPAVVILSEPHPEEYFAGANAAPRLTRFEDKVDFLLGHGIDGVFRLDFNDTLCELSAEDFITRYLVAGLGVKTLIIGDDFRFGKNRIGDFDLLVARGRELGFDVIRELGCELNGERVSSTLVRHYLQQGECEKVRQLLGRYYSISGEVVAGKKLGRELGTPTANIALGFSKLPLHGIFSVLVRRDAEELQGVASIGFNPTVEDSGIPRLEVFLFDFEGDLYGEQLSVSFVKKLRDEETYPDLETLKAQIAVDIDQARQSLAALTHV